MREIETIFKLLGDWYRFPKYQLERRLDIFFALYLPEILKSKINIDIDYKDITPEFPLKKEESYRSTNADYAIFSKRNEKIQLYLMELKTDMHSIKNNQNDYYNRANNCKFSQLLKDIIDIRNNGSMNKISKEKYDTLITYMKNNYGIIKQNNEINTEKIIDKIEIIYLVPKKYKKIEKYKIITFEEVINIIKNKSDDISSEFCKMLEKLI